MFDTASLTEKFIKEHTETITVLTSFSEWNTISRTFMLYHHSEILPLIEKREGEFEGYPENVSNFLITRIYLELFERLCQSIEDFTVLLFSLQQDLKMFNKNITKANSPLKVLKQLTQERWDKILRYLDLNTFDGSEEERNILKVIRGRHFKGITSITAILIEFLELYWVSYTKIKHGNTLVYGTEKQEIDGKEVYFVPVIFDSKNPQNQKILILNNDIYLSWQKLFNRIIMLNQLLIDNTIDFIKIGGHSFLLSPQIQYEVTENDKKVIDLATKTYFQNKVKIEPSVQILMTLNLRTMKEHFSLQEKIMNTRMDF